MSAIRCEMCPNFDGDDGDHTSAQRMGGVGFCGDDERDPEHGTKPRLIYGLAGAVGEARRPLWCPRRRDASKRCRTCGERLVRWAEKGDALIEMYCQRCNP